MSESESAQFVAQNGGKLLTYVEGLRAAIRLQDGRQVVIVIDEHKAEVYRSHGFFDVFFERRILGSFDLQPLHDEFVDGTQITSLTVNAIVLTILIERVSHSLTFGDVRVTAFSGVISALEEATRRLANLKSHIATSTNNV